MHVLGNVQCVVFTTRLPSHSAQVKETRSVYDSELGVKNMAWDTTSVSAPT